MRHLCDSTALLNEPKEDMSQSAGFFPSSFERFKKKLIKDSMLFPQSNQLIQLRWFLKWILPVKCFSWKSCHQSQLALKQEIVVCKIWTRPTFKLPNLFLNKSTWAIMSSSIKCCEAKALAWPNSSQNPKLVDISITSPAVNWNYSKFEGLKETN